MAEKKKKLKQESIHIPSDRDRKLVELATALGGTQEQISSHLGITRPTLIKHYRKELDDGLFGANFSVGTRLFKKAMDGDNTCMLFWMKCRAGWRETDRLELTGADGGPLEVSNVEQRIEDTLKNDPEARKALIALHARAFANTDKEKL